MNVTAVSSRNYSPGAQTDNSTSLAQAKEQLERSLSQVQKGEGMPRQARQLQVDIQQVQGEIREQRVLAEQARESRTAQQEGEARARDQAEATRTADKDNPSNASNNALNTLA